MFNSDCARAQPPALPGDDNLVRQRLSRSGHTTLTLLAASFFLSASGVAVRAGDNPAAQADQAASTNQVLMTKLQAMEKRMQMLEAKLKQKETQTSLAARPAPPAPAAVQSGGPRIVNTARPTATPPQPSDSLAQAISGVAADTAKNDKNKDLFGVGTSPVPGLKIGMYGEIKFGSQQNRADGGRWQNGFDMARVVLLPTYQVTDNIVFNAEIEF